MYVSVSVYAVTKTYILLKNSFSLCVVLISALFSCIARDASARTLKGPLAPPLRGPPLKGPLGVVGQGVPP